MPGINTYNRKARREMRRKFHQEYDVKKKTNRDYRVQTPPEISDWDYEYLDEIEGDKYV